MYLTARDVDRGKEAVKKLESLGFKPQFHQLDITDQKSIDCFAEYIRNKYNGLDLLVNNAAIAYSVSVNDCYYCYIVIHICTFMPHSL